jgi:hypothetical protein
MVYFNPLDQAESGQEIGAHASWFDTGNLILGTFTEVLEDLKN